MNEKASLTIIDLPFEQISFIKCKTNNIVTLCGQYEEEEEDMKRIIFHFMFVCFDRQVTIISTAITFAIHSLEIFAIKILCFFLERNKFYCTIFSTFVGCVNLIRNCNKFK